MKILIQTKQKNQLKHKQTLIFISLFNRLAAVDHVKMFQSAQKDFLVVMLNDGNSLKMIFISRKFFSFYENKRREREGGAIIYCRDSHNVDRVCSSLEITNFIYYVNRKPF
jgi:superfamily II DNA helicase RecQ